MQDFNITAEKAKEIKAKSLRDKKVLEAQKMETIQKNIVSRANVGSSFYFYFNLISKNMAKKLFDCGYELRWRKEKYKKRDITCQHTGVKNDEIKKFPILTLEDFDKNDEYSQVYIIWDSLESEV